LRSGKDKISFYEPGAVITKGISRYANARSSIVELARDHNLLVDTYKTGDLISAFTSSHDFEEVRSLLNDIYDVGGISAGFAFQLFYNELKYSTIFKYGYQNQGGGLTPKKGMDQARSMAIKAWETSDTLKFGVARCDGCGENLQKDEGYLCKSGGFSAVLFGENLPDLLCEKCFKEEHREPWAGPIPSVDISVTSSFDSLLTNIDTERLLAFALAVVHGTLAHHLTSFKELLNKMITDSTVALIYFRKLELANNEFDKFIINFNSSMLQILKYIIG